MKNIINYYYGIISNEFKKKDGHFFFYYKDEKYEFLELGVAINELINIYSIIKSYGNICDEIIINKDNSYITYYNNKPYILLKKNKLTSKIITFDEILEYDKFVYINESINWKDLWKQKIDYYEYQINELGIKYPYLKDSFTYYVALSESAISLLNYINFKNINNFISHRRIETKEDLYNPLNIILDNRTRDISEYIKIRYLKEEITIDNAIELISKMSFSNDEVLLLFSRFLFPSYYFDIYDKIYLGKKEEKDLQKIIKKNTTYEVFLKSIYNFIKNNYNIPQIEFLE